jgi:phosphoribosylformylglycinamidine cyclo-ligase
MFHTFNMGIGFVVIVASQIVTEILDFFASQKMSAVVIGEVITGAGELIGIPE